VLWYRSRLGSAAFWRAKSLSAASAAAATAASSAATFSADFRRTVFRVACRETGRFGRDARAAVSGFCVGNPAALSGLFFGAAAGPGASVLFGESGFGGGGAGIIIGVAGLSGSVGRGGGIGAVATGSSAAREDAVPISIAARMAGIKMPAA
jgi:hypothetical protein